jgi:GAF domain-containing protein
MELTDARYGAAATVSENGGIEHFVHRGLTEEEVGRLPHLPEGKGLLGAMLRSFEPLRLARISDHPESVGFPDRHVKMEAFLGVPLRHRGELVGALYLTKPPGKGEVFSEADEEIVAAMAALAAVAIVNARLFSTETERAERASLLHRIATQVRRSLDRPVVLADTVEALGRAANIDRCLIHLCDPEGRLGTLAAEWAKPGIEPASANPQRRYPITTLALAAKETWWSDDVTADERMVPYEDAASLGGHTARAVLASP